LNNFLLLQAQKFENTLWHVTVAFEEHIAARAKGENNMDAASLMHVVWFPHVPVNIKQKAVETLGKPLPL
jgi:hypothetical protein